MGKLRLAWNAISKFTSKNLPTILSAAALIGLGTSVGMAIKDTPKAVEAVNEAKMDKAEEIERNTTDDSVLDIYRNEDGELDLKKIKLTPWEGFKVLAPIYWRTALSTLCTAAFIVSADRIHNKRYLGAIAALKLSEKRFDEYKNKAKEVFGKKEEEVHKELAKDYIMDSPDEDNIYQTQKGSYLCYESISRTYFRSSIEAVKIALVNFNRRLLAEGVASVADLLYELDIEIKDSYVLDSLVWEYEAAWGKGSSMLEAEFEYASHPRTGEPCLVISYDRNPTWES